MSDVLRTDQVAGKESWIFASDTTECAITKQGGHMAPVTFANATAKPIRPYYISPWQEEGLRIGEPVLVPLRGDFFCLPFGDCPPSKDKNSRTHGEVAYGRWKKSSFTAHAGIKTLTLGMEPKARPGRVTKRISLRDGENVIYLQHELEGFSCKTPLGHHATLAAPAKGVLNISTSPLQFGMTSPRAVAHCAGQAYFALAPNRQFSRLTRVPTLWKDEPWADVSVFPAREGFMDILSLYVRPTSHPTWTCATAPEAGYLWFSLKDPAVLPATTMWIENGGRHESPWNGRNCCIGLEDVCGFHAEGLKASIQPNAISTAGIPTYHTLTKRSPTVINYIQGATAIPRGFDRVKQVRFLENQLTFVADSGATVIVPVQHTFIRSGHLTAD
ncbi:MAG: hypothetical protein HQ523_03745 [Lentisphaerae bacterium]|nr:hypothetical protein [Lentisphaerota bacterium]